MAGGGAAVPAATILRQNCGLPNAPQLSSSFGGQRINVPAIAPGLAQVRRQHVVQAKGTGWLKLGRQAGEEAAKTSKRAAEKGGTSLFKQPQQAAKAGAQANKPGLQKLQLPLPVPRFGSKPQRRDDNVVFVAGATGKVGSRIVRQLAQQGFKVRAGARNVGKGNDLLQLAVSYDLLGSDEARNVSLVTCDLEAEESLVEAIGNASKVVCAVGANEANATDPKGPYNVDGVATQALINAAAEAGVEQFVLVSSLGAGKVGFPAALLNLFWGVLVWKAQSEKVLRESGMAFTIVRPGGMEIPTDSFKETHNLRIAKADTQFGGQVSRLQVAEVVGRVLSNPALAENKILELVAEPTAPVRSIEDMLKDIPVTGLTQAQRAEKARKEEEERIRAEEEAERAAREAEERARLGAELAEAREREAEARREEDAAERELREVEAAAAKVRAQLEAAAEKARQARAVEAAAREAAREGRPFGARERAAVIAELKAEADSGPKAPPKPDKATQEAKRRADAAERKREAAEEARQVAEDRLRAQTKQNKKGGEDASKRKADREEKRKAEAASAEMEEAEAQKAAEAKAKKAEDEKAKKAKEEKAKKAEEEKVKEAAESKAKAEKEDTEAKKQEEEEEKAAKQKKADEEAKKAKAAADAKKAEAEKKAKAEAENVAAAVSQEKEAAAAKAKEEAQAVASVESEDEPTGFRWPWQQPTTYVDEEEPKESPKSAPPQASAEAPSAPKLTGTGTQIVEVKPPKQATPAPKAEKVPAAEASKPEPPKAAAKPVPEAAAPALPKAAPPAPKPAPKVAAVAESVENGAGKAVKQVAVATAKVTEAAASEVQAKADDAARQALEQAKQATQLPSFRWPWERNDDEDSSIPQPVVEAANKVEAAAKSFEWPWEAKDDNGSPSQSNSSEQPDLKQPSSSAPKPSVEAKTESK